MASTTNSESPLETIFAAEKEAQEIIARARKTRLEKLRSVREDAEIELDAFRKELDAKFNEVVGDKASRDPAVDLQDSTQALVDGVEHDYLSHKERAVQYIAMKVLDVQICLTETQKQALKALEVSEDVVPPVNVSVNDSSEVRRSEAAAAPSQALSTLEASEDVVPPVKVSVDDSPEVRRSEAAAAPSQALSTLEASEDVVPPVKVSVDDSPEASRAGVAATPPPFEAARFAEAVKEPSEVDSDTPVSARRSRAVVPPGIPPVKLSARMLSEAVDGVHGLVASNPTEYHDIGAEFNGTDVNGTEIFSLTDQEEGTEPAFDESDFFPSPRGSVQNSPRRPYVPEAMAAVNITPRKQSA
eukprot:TRINITY_DN13281_c0_g1_i1.p1 TRINITY_DN13281_c0_g1~~TRINITY_DN13281_c0_g1_i1.p1  ORF type:complete len:358 (+),score=76.81 TRINITY_DN13281_c0_g1_i1:85-1158(+)